MFDTRLTYDSSDIEHWMSCSRIVHMLGWLFCCAKDVHDASAHLCSLQKNHTYYIETFSKYLGLPVDDR